MEKVSILEFRRDADAVIRKVRQGKSMILTLRGKPVMRLEPIQERSVAENDPFYKITKLAVPGGPALTNEEIDEIVYKE
jgi:prevent-host-death family protein